MNTMQMTGRKFFIEYRAADTVVRYAVARPDGINAWRIGTGNLFLGLVRARADGTWLAVSDPRPLGAIALDPASAARQVVKDSGVATSILGTIHLA